MTGPMTSTVGGDAVMLVRTGPGELPPTLRRMNTSYHAALQILDRLPVPLVAATRSAVAGGGLGLIYVAMRGRPVTVVGVHRRRGQDRGDRRDR